MTQMWSPALQQVQQPQPIDDILTDFLHIQENKNTNREATMGHTQRPRHRVQKINEIGNNDKEACRKLELGCCRNRGTKGPFVACPQQLQSMKRCSYQNCLTYLSFVGSPSVTHTPVTSSLFCCSYRKQSLSQAVPPPLQNPGYSPTIPAGHSLQFTAAVPCVIPNTNVEVSAFFNWIQTEIAGDVIGFCGCYHKTFVLSPSKTEEVCAEHHTMGQSWNKIRLITEH